MPADRLTVALVSEVFCGADGRQRLLARLREAKAQGAELAVLPELALNPWSPATRTSCDDDAEAPGGPRHRLLAEAASSCGLAVLGGAIVRDERGVRRSTALLFDARGTLLGSYCKLHVPQEPGFWEKDHYDPGVEAPRPMAGLALSVGVQICSDVNRPQGSHLLSALGCEAILAPRATEQATWSRWRAVLRANALTSAAYVLSVNRPAPEQGVLIGGPSFAVSPDDEVLLETTDPLGVVTLHRSVVETARRHYPGYLDVRTDLYARAWEQATHEGVAQRIAKGHWEA